MKKITDYLMLIEKLEPLGLFLQFLTLLGFGFVIVWLAQICWFRLLNRSKNYLNEPIDVIGKLSLLRSLITYLVCFAIYFFYLVKHNGLHAFHWAETGFYMVMLPRILAFLLPIGFYLNKNKALRKILK